MLALLRRYRKMKFDIKFEVLKARRVRNVNLYKDILERADNERNSNNPTRSTRESGRGTRESARRYSNRE